MSLKNLIPAGKYERLLSNGLPEHCAYDHYPVAFLSSAASGRQWFISKINSENHSEVFALSYAPAEGVTCGFLNIDEIIATDAGLEYIDRDGEMEMSVYEFAAEVEGYITFDYAHLGEADDALEAERMRDVLSASG